MYYPDYDSDEGLSDDNDYYDFQERIKNRQLEATINAQNFDIENKKRQLQDVFHAIITGKLEIVLEELEKGLDVNADLENGWTPLLLAASSGNSIITSELIKKGANTNAARDGTTVLMMACNLEDKSDNKLEIVKNLVENGAKVKVVDRKRKTALMYTCYKGNSEVVKYLLPSSNKEAQDNQKWTALFWAVDGNQPEVVKLLLNEGCKYDFMDVRNDTPRDHAEFNDYSEIVDLFPKNKSEEKYSIATIVNNNNITFEENFKNLKSNEKPLFISDVEKLLCGVQTECLIPVFANAKLGLFDFLSISDTDLGKLGVAMPYQRNRIVSGLYRFHKHTFHPKSLMVVPKNEIYSNIDVSSNILSVMRQIIAMEASLKFMLKHCDNFDEFKIDKIEKSINSAKNHILKLKRVVLLLKDQSEMWDSSLRVADLITKKQTKIPYIKYSVFITISAIIIYKYWRKFY